MKATQKTIFWLILVPFLFWVTGCQVNEPESTPFVSQEQQNESSEEISSKDSQQTTEDLTQKETSNQEEDMELYFYIQVNDVVFQAIFADNSSALAFKEQLSQGDLTLDMHDYGSFEKVGTLNESLPRNDESITTTPGDVILYQGNSITIYYDVNTWTFTRLGKIQDVTRETLLDALGSGSVTVTFSLNKPE